LANYSKTRPLDLGMGKRYRQTNWLARTTRLFTGPEAALQYWLTNNIKTIVASKTDIM
jgi:hypothetical protein